MRLLLTTTAAIALATSAFAQQLPDAEFLQSRLAGSLPGYWEISDFAVVATTQAGDALRPRAFIRFEAGVAPAADLHVESGSEGPFALLVRTKEQGAPRRLYGVFDLSFSAGVWTGEAMIENPLDGLGQPRDMFVRPTLVVGDPETDSALAALRDTALGTAAAASAREVDRLRSDQAAEIAAMELSHAQAMTELRNRNGIEIAEAGAAFEAERAGLEQAHRAELARLTAEIAPRLAEGEAALQRELAAAETRAAEALRARQAAAAAELAALEATHRAEIERLQSAHAEARAALVAQQEAEVAELRNAEAERARQLAETRRATAEAVRAAGAEGDAELEALRTTHAQRRGEIIQRQRQELAEIETGLATERASLQRQVEAATDVFERQQQLILALQAVARQSDEIASSIQTASEARRASFSGLAGIWEGAAVCSAPAARRDMQSCPSVVRASNLTQAFECRCADGATGTIWGTDIYTSDSATCVAARHAGAIPQRGGGAVLVIPAPGQQQYPGTSRNGVTSSSYGSWGSSFRFGNQGEIAAHRRATGQGAGADDMEQVFVVTLNLTAPFGNGLRGSIENLSHQASGSLSRSEATLIFEDEDVSFGETTVLSIDLPAVLSGAAVFDLVLSAAGSFQGSSRNGSCTSLVVSRRPNGTDENQ